MVIFPLHVDDFTFARPANPNLELAVKPKISWCINYLKTKIDKSDGSGVK